MFVDNYIPENNRVVQESYIDIAIKQIPKPIHFVQYDKGIILAVRMYNAGKLIKIPDNATCNIRVLKPDDKTSYTTALGVSEDGNTVYFEITEQMSVCYGELSSVVEMVIDENTVVSGTIPFFIERNPIQNGIESTDERIRDGNEIEY